MKCQTTHVKIRVELKLQMSDLSADSDTMLSHSVSVNRWTPGHYWRRRPLQRQLFLIYVLNILKLQNYFHILKYLFFESLVGGVTLDDVESNFCLSPVCHRVFPLVCAIVVVCTRLCVSAECTCSLPAFDLLSAARVCYDPLSFPLPSPSLPVPPSPPTPNAPRPYNLLY